MLPAVVEIHKDANNTEKTAFKDTKNLTPSNFNAVELSVQILFSKLISGTPFYQR
ncbi:hypothetical protein CHA01nite_23270 [Chryseobacterium hagamense]|uniref:Uncharacterized protein n=1 Tax=Chryseobacterium hagamense TaxID=395935 RepID=A0A511YN13_9FLAO|nr:hypothetical protein CHA01nite_23270 [Chryseobacterium hagamense]